MNKGPMYFNQPPAGVPQPANSPYQPGFTGYSPVQQGAQPQQAPQQPQQQPWQPQQAQGAQYGYTGYQAAQPRPNPYAQGAAYNPYAAQGMQQAGTAYRAQPLQGAQNNPYAAYQPQGMPGRQQPMPPYQAQGMQPGRAGTYQQPVQPGRAGQMTGYGTAYQPVQMPQGMPAQPVYPQGYPYQVNGVPQQAQPVYNATAYQPVSPAKPKVPVDTDGVLRLALYIALPVLIILFALGMAFTSLTVLKWLFVAAAAVIVVMLWVRPLVRDDIRLTISCIAGVLAVVSVVGAVTGGAPSDAKNPSQAQSQVQQQAAMPTQTPYVDPFAGYGGYDTTVSPATPTPAPASSGMQSAAVERMESFMYFWTVNDFDSMLTLCAPSWVRKQKIPKNSLFSVLANRTAVEYNATAITGTDNDLSRTISVAVSIHRNNGTAPRTYLFKVLMVREDDNWYIDPASLESNEEATATPASAVITQMPTPAPVADANQLLFYNPDGGNYYHLDSYCKSANARNLPFKGSFTYGQLNDAAYANLIACPVCAAPKRPSK